MDEAPIPNPAAAERSAVAEPASSQYATREIPSRPSPPTERPITAPPLYDISSAADCPFLAAIAVLPLAAVAERMPENPASTDVIAPARNAIAVLVSLMNAKRAPTTTTKTAMTLYSAKRNAIAPSCISLVISATLGSVISTLVTFLYNTKAIIRPKRPAAAAISGIFSIIVNT